jgi:hypothetical protein
MTDNTKADEYLQEQLVEQGDVSSMRYIGDDYTRIVTIREDRLLNIITAYTNKQIEGLLNRLVKHFEGLRVEHCNVNIDLELVVKKIEDERNKLEAEL